MMLTPKVQIRKSFVKGTKCENLSTKELKNQKSTEGDGAREEWVAAVGWRGGIRVRLSFIGMGWAGLGRIGPRGALGRPGNGLRERAKQAERKLGLVLGSASRCRSRLRDGLGRVAS